MQGVFWCLVFCLIALEGCQAPFADPSLDFPSTSITPTDQPHFLDQPYTLAILPLENLSQHAHLNWLGRGLQTMLMNDLSKWPHLEVVSREALGPVLREQWLQQRGFSSSANPVNLGQVKGARYLIQGSIYASHELLTINLQIVSVETGVVMESIRAQGVETEIPHLEHDLVTQVMRFFDSSPYLHKGAPSNERADVERSPDNNEKRGQIYSFAQLPSHSVHQIDALLSLEKLTHQRREAYELAESIWRDGWSFEIGQPIYHIRQISSQPLRSVSVMDIPISAFFSPHRIVDIFKNASNGETDTGMHFDSEGFHIAMDDSSGAKQLFIENFHRPRRVFIRALNEHGDVLAVFSHWTWRSNKNNHLMNPQHNSVPMWPRPFITGLAQFPVDWIEREGQQVIFDAAVVPVPDEQVIVMLEPLEESAENKKSNLEQTHQEENLLQAVENLVRSQWAPAITEALPLPGYLPGNKRTAVGMVGIQKGKIVHIQFQSLPEEPFFIRSLLDLQAQLLGTCVECQDSDTIVPSSSQFNKTLRLQLTLVKDIHALQLGSRSR